MPQWGWAALVSGVTLPSNCLHLLQGLDPLPQSVFLTKGTEVLTSSHYQFLERALGE